MSLSLFPFIFSPKTRTRGKFVYIHIQIPSCIHYWTDTGTGRYMEPAGFITNNGWALRGGRAGKLREGEEENGAFPLYYIFWPRSVLPSLVLCDVTIHPCTHARTHTHSYTHTHTHTHIHTHTHTHIHFNNMSLSIYYHHHYYYYYYYYYYNYYYNYYNYYGQGYSKHSHTCPWVAWIPLSAWAWRVLSAFCHYEGIPNRFQTDSKQIPNRFQTPTPKMTAVVTKRERKRQSLSVRTPPFNNPPHPCIPLSLSFSFSLSRTPNVEGKAHGTQ